MKLLILTRQKYLDLLFEIQSNKQKYVQIKKQKIIPRFR